MNIEHGLKLLICGLLNDVVPGVAGIVDDDVERPESSHGGGDQFLRKIGRRDISGQRLRVAAGLIDQHSGFENRIAIQIVQHHLRAGLGQLPRDHAANAAPRSGDQRRAALQVEKHVHLYSTRETGVNARRGKLTHRDSHAGLAGDAVDRDRDRDVARRRACGNLHVDLHGSGDQPGG